MEDVKEGKDYSFPLEEEQILEFWNTTDAFKEQLRRTEGKPEFVFYDGPPFATGLPHYGHILAGTIKVFKTHCFIYLNPSDRTSSRVTLLQRGITFHEDLDGIVTAFPSNTKSIELSASDPFLSKGTEWLLDIKSREDVLKMGIPVYNEECRKIVMRYSKEWEKTVNRLGRWIDFENDYKTLDPNFMESVWWVFKQLYEKDLVYQGFKVKPTKHFIDLMNVIQVMAYSTGCSTPLSNFEAGLNYKDVQDPSVLVKKPFRFIVKLS